ncbi:MAG: C-type lectin domain-containing protein [Reichenbachiella sp.]|uniref:C-type lectin domain-containing protein n=1 Tax=Reichenbachiella sp. TaxID=2184521 RepID=UPI003264AA35
MKSVPYLIFGLFVSCLDTVEESDEEFFTSEENMFCERFESKDYSSYDDLALKCQYTHEDGQDIRTYEFVGCKTKAQYTQWLDSMRCYDYVGLTSIDGSYFEGVRTISGGSIECDCSRDFNIEGYDYVGNFNDHLYYISDARTSWTNANDLANRHGHLVTITSEEENQFILNIIGEGIVWIGLHDSNTEGDFEWVTGELVDYTNWRAGEPNNLNDGDYVLFWGTNGWLDLNDSGNLFSHILEIE